MGAAAQFALDGNQFMKTDNPLGMNYKVIVFSVLLICQQMALGQLVGIGTNTPSAYLDIRPANDPNLTVGQNYASLSLTDNGTEGPYFKFTNTTSLNNWLWQARTNLDGTGLMRWIYNGNTKLEINHLSYLGIDTAAVAPLAINASGINPLYTNGPDDNVIQISEGGSLRGFIGQSRAGTTRDIALGATTGSLSLVTNSQRRLVISNTGYIGVGTTNPNFNLSVGGSLVVNQANDFDGTFTRNKMFSFGNSATAEGIGSQRTTGVNQFGLDFYLLGARRLSILNNGNVGVGVSNPQYKLDIANDLKTSRFIFNNGINLPRIKSGTLSSMYSANLGTLTIPLNFADFDPNLPVQVLLEIADDDENFAPAITRTLTVTYKPTTNTSGEVWIRDATNAGSFYNKMIAVNYLAIQNY